MSENRRIVPRKVGDKPDVVSCAEARARELKEWMRLRLGSGEKTRAVLGVNAEKSSEIAIVELDSARLSFEDLVIEKV